MLVGKNVVIVKNDDKTLSVQDYDRIYLEYASSDPLETYGKTVDGTDLTVNGSKWEGSKPKENITANTTQEAIAALVQDAIGYFTGVEAAKVSKAGVDGAGKALYTAQDPWLVLMEAASYGNDLWTRNKLQASIRPSKPISVESANLAMAKKMVASGQAKSIEGALKKLALLATMEEE